MWSNFLLRLIAGWSYITTVLAAYGVPLMKMIRVLGDPVAREADGKQEYFSVQNFIVSATSRAGTGNCCGCCLAIAMEGVLCSDVGYCCCYAARFRGVPSGSAYMSAAIPILRSGGLHEARFECPLDGLASSWFIVVIGAFCVCGGL